jgi:hypothetical protein
MSKLKIASAVRRERLSYEAFMARHRSDLKSAEFLFRDDLGSEYTLMGTSMAEMLAVAFCQPLLHQCMRELKNHPFIRVLRAARSENCPDAYTKLLFLWLCWMDVAPPEARHEQLQTHLDTMYVDKLEGRITQEFFDRQADTWRREQNAILRRIHDIQTAAPAPIKEAIDGLSLTSRACELFLQQSAAEQRRLLQTLVKSATWQDGALRTSLFEPFEILRHSNQGSCRNEMENSGSGRNFEIWLLR